MRRIVDLKVILLTVIIVAFSAVNLLGNDFPNRPINLYVGFAPGGAVALTAPIIAEGMKKYLKQPVFVNFKPGAGQALAADFIKNSKPDGYNLFNISIEPMIAKVVVDGPTLAFRFEDFESLGAGPNICHILAVNAESRWKTLEDFIADARKSPGRLSIGHVGQNTNNQMKEVLFCMKTGIVLNEIPHAGAGQVVPALLGKHIDAGTGSLTSFAPHLKPGGALRALVVFDQKRNADFPDVPTALEKGIDITSIDHFGLQAPKGLPKETRTSIVQAFKKTTEDPEVIATFKKLVGVGLTYIAPEEMDRKILEDYKLFQDIAKRTGAIK